MSNLGFQKLLEVIEKHREDGYEVQCVRMDSDSFYELLKEPDLIMRYSDRAECIEFEKDESVAFAASTEIIHDSDISEPVADDVRGMWRDE